MGKESAPVLVGKVTKIVDGDTIDVMLESGLIRVRLHAIDAPEKSQPYGKEASAALSTYVLNETVELEPFEQDRYERLIAVVYRGDKNINQEMVKGGNAWAYRKYMRQTDSSLCTDEFVAKAGKRGLWSLPEKDRVAPWEYRKRKTLPAFTDYSHQTARQCVEAVGGV